VQALPSIGMLGTEHCLADSQCALDERPSACKVVLGLKQLGEVAQAHRCVRVFGTKHVLRNRQGALEEPPRTRNVTRPLEEQEGEIVKDRRRIGVLRAEYLLLYR